MDSLKQVLIERETIAVLAVLLVAMATIPHLILTYYPIALATYVRNAHLASIGMGPLFYLVAFVGAYVEAVVLAALFRVLRSGYRQLGAQNAG